MTQCAGLFMQSRQGQIIFPVWTPGALPRIISKRCVGKSTPRAISKYPCGSNILSNHAANGVVTECEIGRQGPPDS